MRAEVRKREPRHQQGPSLAQIYSEIVKKIRSNHIPVEKVIKDKSTKSIRLVVKSGEPEEKVRRLISPIANDSNMKGDSHMLNGGRKKYTFAMR